MFMKQSQICKGKSVTHEAAIEVLIITFSYLISICVIKPSEINPAIEFRVFQYVDYVWVLVNASLCDGCQNARRKVDQ
jgi:hypothetical protein